MDFCDGLWVESDPVVNLDQPFPLPRTRTCTIPRRAVAGDDLVEVNLDNEAIPLEFGCITGVWEEGMGGAGFRIQQTITTTSWQPL